mgnify:CR=1 FL=1
MKYHLYLSPEFAYRLSKIGMLEALIHEYRKFKEDNNYPFELNDKRIIRQTIFKGLCDYYGNIGKKTTIEQILKQIDKIADEIYGEKPKNTAEITMEELREYQEKIKKNQEEKTAEEKIPIIEE